VFGEVITKEGLDDADDEDYVKFSQHMVEASKEVVSALEREDTESIRKHVSDIRQRCDVCHEQFR
jgi:cytochrome c556